MNRRTEIFIAVAAMVLGVNMVARSYVDDIDWLGHAGAFLIGIAVVAAAGDHE